MTPHRPRILVTYSMDDPVASAWLRHYLHTLANGAVAALRAAGADVNVVDVTCAADFAESSTAPAAALLDDVDGLLILGGGDIDPSLYGEEPTTATLYAVNARSDRFELVLAAAAMQNRMPLLGICRGLQVLNVAAGGSIVQDLGVGTVHAAASGNSSMTDHDVRLVAGSVLSKIYQSLNLRIRSGHHQAVSRVGDGLSVVGGSSDGVIEALEGTASWVLGVQWHPEDPDADQADLARLMTAFVAECSRNERTSRSSSLKSHRSGT